MTNITIARAKLAIAAIACLLALTARAASPAAETQFLSEVRSAFEARDPAKLLTLVCWDHVELDMRQGIEQQFSNLMRLVPIRIELIAPDPKVQYEYSRGGKTYRTNLAVTRQMRVEFNPKNEFNTTEMTMPLGEKDGRVFITTATPVE